jgi:hypothetical protein
MRTPPRKGVSTSTVTSTRFHWHAAAAESVNVRLNLAGVVRHINPKNMQLLSPDNVAKELKEVSVNGAAVTFTIPKIEVYDVVAIN